MSYCVNCGVELDKTCGVCPLCNTEVINPRCEVDRQSPKPYPTEKGKVEHVAKHEKFGVFTIILAVTASVCAILNSFVFQDSRWASYVIGVCIMLWIFTFPGFFPKARNVFINYVLDVATVILYLGWISHLHPGNGWYLNIAVPLVVLTSVLILIFVFFSIKHKRSFIGKTAIVIGIIGIVSLAIEALFKVYMWDKVYDLSWSVVVMACALSIDVVLLLVASIKSVRYELRKRLHF
ncbi:MAG: DUF6320 domain-containing protein [Eubacterium sp.]|nr:DUF6320 domain-containing protein [Eubacterium sp.]